MSLGEILKRDRDDQDWPDRPADIYHVSRESDKRILKEFCAAVEDELESFGA
ncbi:hypothetical protein HPP92_007489 [Vanilla planifolia]|uniref:Uncharacterized protein n=1 Tax=Vanilla planifolia TaxID=51239 RepID=A0A835V8R8_VANPL|nr:hypothetical protein HPP92_007489 [Vanilla planifolia]